MPQWLIDYCACTCQSVLRRSYCKYTKKIRTFRDVFRSSRQWMDRVGVWVDGRVGGHTSSTQVEGLTAEWVNGLCRVSAWMREWDLSKMNSWVR